MGNYQTANDVENNNSNVYNANASYSYAVAPTHFSLAAGANVNINSYQGLDNTGIGPNVSITKGLMENKVRTSLGFNRLDFLNGGDIVTTTNNVRLSLSYTLKKKHSFSANGAWLAKNDQVRNEKFQEIRGTIQYSYRFSK